MPLGPRNEPRQELRQAPTVLIGQSQETMRMRDFADKAAATDHTILLQGETGAGKDHLAELIHYIGRRGRAFVPVDCGALTESLSETELFGHTRGAFTDAQSVKEGLVQVAEDGTLFFNEVANMSLSLQAKFLRVLEKRSFRPVGGTREIPVNTRIIAATNANLEAAVRKGELRSDLYHRLNTITFMIAPLRERKEDVPILTNHFLHQEHPTKNFSPEAMAVMIGYHWPGNVRELKNAVVRAAFHSTVKEKEIQVEHVHPYLTGVGAERELPTLHELQRNYLKEVLKKTRGNVSKGAEIADIERNTMHYKVKKFQLEDFVDSLKREVMN
ncbi:MAG: sigma-54 dependent transcriptional regulator [Candidatus Doudnabacteria bacterium]|nr:sigma-54 dependent transcriptional regulator [Candidatus Doudnabacteria bacterium]